MRKARNIVVPSLMRRLYVALTLGGGGLFNAEEREPCSSDRVVFCDVSDLGDLFESCETLALRVEILLVPLLLVEPCGLVVLRTAVALVLRGELAVLPGAGVGAGVSVLLRDERVLFFPRELQRDLIDVFVAHFLILSICLEKRVGLVSPVAVLVAVIIVDVVSEVVLVPGVIVLRPLVFSVAELAVEVVEHAVVVVQVIELIDHRPEDGIEIRVDGCCVVGGFDVDFDDAFGHGRVAIVVIVEVAVAVQLSEALGVDGVEDGFFAVVIGGREIGFGDEGRGLRTTDRLVEVDGEHVSVRQR